MVSKAEVLQFAPKAKPALVSAIVDNWHYAEDAGINTPARVTQFMSNIAVETGGLTAIVENMNYTTVAQLRRTWPSRFKSDASAQPFVRNPQGLAIKVYSGRMGNAAGPSTDGWDYRGGGMMQTTGREGYRKMGFEDNPAELQSNPKTAFLTAVREWQKRGCNALADAGDTTAIRKKINGGLNGIDHVRDYLRKAEKVWSTGAKTVPAKVTKTRPTPAATVKKVQAQLHALGYTEVGTADGKLGTMTRAAILSFRAENNLPLTVEIDAELQAALKKASPRNFAEGRTTAPLKEVVAKVPEVKANATSQTISSVTAGGSATAAVVVGIGGQLDEATAYLNPVLQFADGIPSWVWLLIMTGIAVSIYVVNSRGVKEGIKAFHSGERR